MTPEQLKEVLAEHRLWLDTEGKEGKKANLSGANLSRANLYGANLAHANLQAANLYRANLEYANLYRASLARADLRRANLMGANLEGADLVGADLYHTTGNMKEIKSIQLGTYSIAYTADRLQIRCENHSIEAWKGFSDEDIEEMDSGVLEWWGKYRDHIFKTIELSPATPTKHQEKE